jgi:hypothetical protein
MDEVSGDEAKAIDKLSFAIRSFHIKYQDAVVKPGNVLYDLIDMGFISVDWDRVAHAFVDAQRGRDDFLKPSQ